MRSILIVGAFLAASPVLADERHWSPAECLDVIDAREIDAALASIDLAAFVLTDRLVVAALARAAERGVAVRIVLDGREHSDFRALVGIADSIRVRPSAAYLHLKAFAIDGATLRTGSANFSYSGEREQENELSISRNAGEVARFEACFQRIWRDAVRMDEFPAAVSAAEPE